MTTARAVLKYQRGSAQKMRLVADQVRGLPVSKALDVLKYSPKAAAKVMTKVLISAIANAENNQNLDIDSLKISRLMVDEGPTLKRFRARAKGRGTRILKRGCHVTLEVTETE